MRLFVAIEIPDELRDRIESDIVAPLRETIPGARWTRPEGRHLTLKFLGNVGQDVVDDVAGAVGAAAVTHSRFEASFAEVGAFPNLRRPRVLWIGVGEGNDEMAALAGSIETAVEPLGFEPEGRPFRGHLTLARFPRPDRVDVAEIAFQLSRFPVEEVTLFESRLHPKGARYTPLRRFPLEF